MAAGWMRHLSAGRVDVYSGGSDPADRVNPAAIAVMAERGVDIAGERPKHWTDDGIRTADVVVTMGCGDTCPVYAGTRYVDWELEDPSGLPIAEIRPIRDEIEERVRGLLAELAGLDRATRN